MRYLLTLLVSAGVLYAQTVQAYRSSTAGERMTRLPPLRFGPAVGAQTGVAFEIRHDQRQQRIIGFGASFLEAGAICLNALPEKAQDQLLSSLFDPVKGAGFSAMKTPIAATDFMSAGPWYSYAETPGDVEMRSFSIARDLGPNGVIPYIRKAKRHGRFVLQAPMDYPPDWMLFDVEKNQDVDPKYFDALALYYLRYAQEYEKNGVFVDYVCLFNEPYVYTKISYHKIRDLLKNHVGPLFAKHGMKNRLQPCEPSRREHAHKNLHVILDDPEARKYVANVPYHGYDFVAIRKPPTPENGYDFREFKLIADLTKRYPDLPFWMTEVCFWNNGTPWARPLPRAQFEDADFWVNQLAEDLEAGAAGWTYWNMLLDENGGPWLVSPVHGNLDNNQQQPVVIVNRKTKAVTYTGVYYALAHFSRFVRPGSVKLGVQGDAEAVRCLAFERPDNSVAAVLINSRKENVAVRIAFGSRTLLYDAPRGSITTLVWKLP